MSGPVVDGIDLGALNYTAQVPYNETNPEGGNSLIQDLNVHYEVRTASIGLNGESIHLLMILCYSRVIWHGCSCPPLSSCS